MCINTYAQTILYHKGMVASNKISLLMLLKKNREGKVYLVNFLRLFYLPFVIRRAYVDRILLSFITQGRKKSQSVTEWFNCLCPFERWPCKEVVLCFVVSIIFNPNGSPTSLILVTMSYRGSNLSLGSTTMRQVIQGCMAPIAME